MARTSPSTWRSSQPSRGVDGRGWIFGATDPTMSVGRIGDSYVNTVTKHAFGPKTAAGWTDNGLFKGDEGWTAVEAVVSDGARRVRRIVDWTGGAGTKPATGQYVGATGLVTDIAAAVDVRGAEGPAMLIDGLDPGADDVTYDTLAALAEVGDDNLRHPLKNLAAAGGHMPFPTVAAATAVNVPARVKTVAIMAAADDLGGNGHLRRRVDADPGDVPKHRSLDRFTSDGSTDSVNGGWWARIYTSAVSTEYLYKDDAAFPTPVYHKLRETLSIKEIRPSMVSGEAGDDATAYVQEWAEELAKGTRGTPTFGTYDVSEKILITGTKIAIDGDNKQGVWLNYTGPDFTTDEESILQIGDGITTTGRAIVRGLGIKSATTLTKGWGFRSDSVTTANYDVRVDDGTRKVFGGLRASNSNYVDFSGSEAASGGPKLGVSDCVEVYTNGFQAYGHLVSGQPAGGGIIIGGGVGGFYWGGQTLFLEVGMIVDKSLSENANLQLIFLPNSWIDSSRYAGLRLDDDSDPNYVGRLVQLRGQIGTVLGGPGVDIVNWAGNLTHAGLITNVYGDGIHNADAAVKIQVPSSGEISNVFGGYGINSTVPISIIADAQPVNCSLGAFGANVTSGRTIYGPQTVNIDPATTWLFDGSGNANRKAFNAAADVALPAGSGIIHASILETGDGVTLEIGGGVVSVLAYTGGSTGSGYENMTATPASGKWSCTFTGGAYHFISNLAGTKTLVLTLILKSRDGV